MKKVIFEEVYADAYVRKSIDVIIEKTIIRRPDLEPLRKDMEQELLIGLNKAVSRYNPERSGSIKTFARKVLDLEIKRVIRDNCTQKAICNRLANEVDETIIQEGVMNFRDNSSRMLQLRMDIDSVLALLPVEQQNICEAIMSGKALETIAAEKNMPISTFYKKHVYQLRKIFSAKNLDDYIKKM